MKLLQHVWSIYLRVTARLPALRSIVPFIPLLIAWTLVTELAVFPRVFLPGPVDVVNAIWHTHLQRHIDPIFRR